MIELGLLAVLVRWLRVPPGRTLAVALAANLFTHGSLWVLLPLLSWPRWLETGVLELGVFLVEGTVYFLVARIRPPWVGYAVALGLNLASYLTGVLVWSLIRG